MKYTLHVESLTYQNYVTFTLTAAAAKQTLRRAFPDQELAKLLSELHQRGWVQVPSDTADYRYLTASLSSQ